MYMFLVIEAALPDLSSAVFVAATILVSVTVAYIDHISSKYYHEWNL